MIADFDRKRLVCLKRNELLHYIITTPSIVSCSILYRKILFIDGYTDMFYALLLCFLNVKIFTKTLFTFHDDTEFIVPNAVRHCQVFSRTLPSTLPVMNAKVIERRLHN